MSTSRDLKTEALRRIRAEAIGARRLELTFHIFNKTGGVVEAGPFRGMKLEPLISWGRGDLAAMLLGFYEKELESTIERAADTGYDLVVNIGAAEGYYAVGLARLLPQCQVIAIDIDKKSHEVCGKNAEKNGVASRMKIRGQCTTGDLQEILDAASSALLIVDCEGGELEILSPQAVPAVDRCDIIVECHDFIDRQITPKLRERFQETHDIEFIEQGGRNPSASKHLRGMGDQDRWLLISENRPETMHWLVMRHR